MSENALFPDLSVSCRERERETDRQEGEKVEGEKARKGRGREGERWGVGSVARNRPLGVKAA